MTDASAARTHEERAGAPLTLNSDRSIGHTQRAQGFRRDSADLSNAATGAALSSG
jgi:hypothetical protein